MHLPEIYYFTREHPTSINKIITNLFIVFAYLNFTFISYFVSYIQKNKKAVSVEFGLNRTV